MSTFPAPLNIAVTLAPAQLEALAQRVAEIIGASPALTASDIPPGPYLSVDEAAQFLRAKRQRVYDLISQKRLTPYGTSGSRLIARDELKRFVNGEPTGPLGARMNVRQ